MAMDDDDASRLLAFNDDRLGRFLFGRKSAEAGSLRALAWILVFVVVFGSAFYLLR
jgi:hypothetical protein